MIHLRAKNLTKSGVLYQWIFKSPKINEGDEIAIIQHDDGSKSIVRTSYSGVLVKTLKAGSKVVNGTALANLASNEEEVRSYKDWKTKEIKNENVEQVSEITREETKKDDALSRIAELRASVNTRKPTKPKIEMPKPVGAAANIFQKDDNGQSEFKKIIEARKNDLLKKEEYKEVKEEHVDALSKVDAKGRPLIMRNIIAARREKYDSSGGDSSVLTYDRVATKENAPKNMKEEVFDMASIISKGQEIDYNLYEEEDDSFAIVNSPNGHYTTQFPTKNKASKTLIEKAKKNPASLSYHERKMLRFYDENLRKESLANTPTFSNNKLSSNGGVFWKNKLPYVFTREVPWVDPMTGEEKITRYIDTPKGKNDYDIYLNEGTLPEINELPQARTTVQNNNLNPNSKQYNNDNSDSISNIHLDEINKKVEEKIASAANSGNETIRYLKDEIGALRAQLEKKNQLDEATEAIRRNFAPNQNIQPSSGSTSDTFSQLMQYMLMQNIVSSLNTSTNNNISQQPQPTIQPQPIPQPIPPQQPYYQQPMPHFGYGPLGADFNEGLLKKIIKEELSDFSKEIDGYSKNEMIRRKKETRFNNQKMHEPVDYTDYYDNTTEDFSKGPGYIEFDEQASSKIEREKLNRNRDSVVKSMIMSQNYVPPLTISVEIDMSEILKIKNQLKKAESELKFPSMSFIIKAISSALKEYPKINSSYDADKNELIVKKYHNIGIATETSHGLVIPVLKFVEKLSVKDIAIDIKEVTLRLRKGKLFDYEVEGSTITVANYGNVGAIQATPTIFYPNTAVIGVGKIIKKPLVVDNQNIAIKAVMNMTLTVDQRTIEASEAGNFLNRVKTLLESPEYLTLS